jgi:hypothetical protein
MTDDDFLAQLHGLTLPPAQFNHLGHVRLAWLCLKRHPVEDATALACGTIAAYAASLGAAGKVHRTITVALMRLMHAAGARRYASWSAFADAHPDLLTGAHERLARHYSAALLASEAARASFVAPDLQALPA